MALHVLQLGPYPPPEGGITRNMLAIRDELAANGDRCSIVVTSRSSLITNEPNVYHPGSAISLLKLLRTIKFHVLHLHIGGDVSARVLALAFMCTVMGRGRSVLTLHSGQYPLTEAARDAAPGSIRGRIFSKFSRIIAVSEAIADVFGRYGVPADRIATIPPFSLSQPDENVSVPSGIVEFKCRRSPLLVAVGGLEKDYDPLFQIAAMNGILNVFPNAGLLIVGDGSLRADVESAIDASEYADHIHLAGNVQHGVTLHLIKGADITLRTTLFDGDAISIRESLFLGTPVIATDNRMRPEGVHLIPVGSMDGLAKTISEILSKPATTRNIEDPDASNIAAVIALYRGLVK